MGTSSRALETNNIAGIKHGSSFAKYDNVGESINNLATLIKNSYVTQLVNIIKEKLFSI
jgi:hypothetical protein